jgi:hypothetical protein
MFAGWRADCERHHHETIEAVRSTANEQVSFNVQGVSISKVVFVNYLYLKKTFAVS